MRGDGCEDDGADNAVVVMAVRATAVATAVQVIVAATVAWERLALLLVRTVQAVVAATADCRATHRVCNNNLCGFQYDAEGGYIRHTSIKLSLWLSSDDI